MSDGSDAHDARITVDVHLGPDDLRDALEADARAGLTATPKDLPPKYFYDDRGSQLFDDITRLARVLPDPRRAGRSSPREPTRSPRSPEPTRSSSSGRGRRRRRGCCSTRSRAPVGCAASCRST